MLALVILAAVIIVVGGIAMLVLGGNRRFDEVERFHRASRMTTEWSRGGVTSPVVQQPSGPDEERAGADAGRRSE